MIDKQPAFKNELFNQYYSTKKTPIFDLFLADFFCEDELNTGFKEMNRQVAPTLNNTIVAANFYEFTPFEKRIKELNKEFTDKILKDKLPLKYYCHDIEKTIIVTTLKQINNEYEILKKSIFDEKTDKYKEAEIRADSIKKLSKRLNEFSTYIINDLINNNENIHLHIRKADKLKMDSWQILKSNFSNELQIHSSQPGETKTEFSETVKNRNNNLIQ